MIGQSIEIARQTRPECDTSISARIETDGSLRFEGGDVGELPKRMFGDEDYEYWVTVPTAEIGRLILFLLKEKYGGNINAVDEFRGFCETNGVRHEFMVWT
jgi:hypothetical protein